MILYLKNHIQIYDYIHNFDFELAQFFLNYDKKDKPVRNVSISMPLI